ncbi:TRAP transporter small permease [Roseospira marina]|uniref:TRAP transporter small permease protein n=1 Tax=Roseospira marina TaxID=140057 RepID=A0A5M6IA09_9PROT|nr:TRAP transporter small permease [Roseospira marina]KAA5605104.1 TRAP transporter small permease [Roseospira marina]MBB4314853.1 C4-dicarboxylate transporter DctQ subunit [Roseospira marina]MBB5087853.1 C4-dicarboxylate transporter DctQ subunit [Roseospira marina]
MQTIDGHHHSDVVDAIERTGISIALGLMTLVTFANVVARYVFNSNILWALETTVFLFAWLVLLGASHLVKTSGHIGVDLVQNLVPPGPRKLMVLLSVALCVVFSALLLVGAVQYWWPFATDRAWYEVNDIPMVLFPDLFADVFNEGESYEKMPRFLPYAALPLGMLLLMFRFLQAGWHIATSRRSMLIASHEAEDIVADATEETRKRDQAGEG